MAKIMKITDDLSVSKFWNVLKKLFDLFQIYGKLGKEFYFYIEFIDLFYDISGEFFNGKKLNCMIKAFTESSLTLFVLTNR